MQILSLENRANHPKPAYLQRIAAVLEDINFAHTIFALPFALASAHLAFLATGGYKLNILIAILVCMVTARTAAMSYNRYLDRDIDEKNIRTRTRSIPSGKARPSDAIFVVLLSSLLFILTCWYLGQLTLLLSIPTLIFILSYSASKRFTILTHLWLGAALALAPLGAWIAVTQKLDWIPVVLAMAVIFWVAGFDIIYALQDIDFDRQNHIFSFPACMGAGLSLWFARGFHAVSFVLFAMFGYIARLNWEFWFTYAVTGILLIYEHSIISEKDLSRVGIAFFTINGIISILIFVGTILGSLPFT